MKKLESLLDYATPDTNPEFNQDKDLLLPKEEKDDLEITENWNEQAFGIDYLDDESDNQLNIQI